MDNNHSHEPWQQDSYETGRTNPPKSRRGLLALLLVTIIFLGGIASALGIMNIRLFKRLQNSSGGTGMSFYESADPTDPTQPSDPTEPTHVAGDITIELNKTPDAVENVPQEGGLSLQQIYTKVIDSVVSISCNTGSGSGVVLSEKGYIVTNCHVVSGAQTIQVLFSDGRTLSARIVGKDAVADLAVLQVDATDLTAAEFGDSASVRVGDCVAAIGDPLGLEFRGTMTDGIISAINRNVSINGRTMNLLQTNAALNSGNSGGPLLNCYGQVIGINTMKIGAFTDSAGVEGLGFAIPSATVKEVVDQLIAKGYVSGRPSLHISGEEVSSTEQRWFRVPAGYRITAIEQGGSADEAGLETGDVILSINSTRITDPDSFDAALYTYQVGDTVSLVIYRSGRQYTLSVVLGEAQG